MLVVHKKQTMQSWVGTWDCN